MDNIYLSLPTSSPVNKAVFWELCTSRRLANVSKSILRGIPDIVTSRENLILSLCVLWFTHCPQRKKQLGITEKSNIADFKVKNKEHAMETLKLINHSSVSSFLLILLPDYYVLNWLICHPSLFSSYKLRTAKALHVASSSASQKQRTQIWFEEKSLRD